MASGKLLVRMSQDLHAVLQKAAERTTLSLNDVCCQRLSARPTLPESLLATVLPAVLAAEKTAGDALVAIVLFGSWARGTQSDQSDIDLLIVLDKEFPITRGVYRSWETHAMSAGKCEPHFVTLPSDINYVTGLWAEIALDGVVLSDDSARLHRYLVQVRRALVDGKLLSRKSHGQTYWVRNEVA
jgi:Nucleotidyltransferase domain/HicB family